MKKPTASRACRPPLSARLRSTASWLALAAVAVLFLLPFLWMLSTSFKADRQVFAFPPEWLPRPAHLGELPGRAGGVPLLALSHQHALPLRRDRRREPGLLRAAGVRVRADPVPRSGASLRADALHDRCCPHRRPCSPSSCCSAGWAGSAASVHSGCRRSSATPFFIFLLRQFFRTIPRELSDAARIDGCGEAGIFWRIVLPLSRPALASVALFSFIGTWTDFLGPLVYLHDERQFTLALGLTSFLGRHGAEWNLLMAAATVVTAPLILLFLLTQRTFVKGVALSGLKG